MNDADSDESFSSDEEPESLCFDDDYGQIALNEVIIFKNEKKLDEFTIEAFKAAFTSKLGT